MWFALVLSAYTLSGEEMVVVLDSGLTAAECESKANDVEEVLILGIGEGFNLTCENPQQWSE